MKPLQDANSDGRIPRRRIDARSPARLEVTLTLYQQMAGMHYDPDVSSQKE